MVDRRRYWKRGAVAVVSLAATLTLAACGGTPFPTSSAASTPAPAPARSVVSIAAVVPTLPELGKQWDNDGETVHSPDVDHPPASCRPYAGALTAPHRVLVHQYSFLPTPAGYESGGASFTVAAVARPSVTTDVLRATASEAYRRCALDTAARWLSDQPNYVSMSAEQVPVPGDLPGVMWRVRADFNGGDAYYLDILYLGNDSVLVKARIGVCGCAQERVGTTIVVGENAAIEHIAHALGMLDS
jgi:hypothetical protein